MATEAPDLPGPLRSQSAYPLAGRAGELEKLGTLLPRAEGEGRRVALIAGEPGIGKSRLVREFAAGAARSGALVLYGACDAAAGAPYGPFVEALDRLARVTEPAVLRAAIGPSGELSRLLPELPSLLGEMPAPIAADPDTERHRLHLAVSETLAGLSRQAPILLVIEDAHWADRPTLALVRHLTRSAWSARLLLLVTYRDESEPPELGELLADLRRSEDVVRIRLAGLSGAEVAELVAGAVGGEIEPGRPPGRELAELAAAIHDLTDGNAFLVCELCRVLAETGVVEVDEGGVRITGTLSELGSPESVREVVSQRLSRLDPPTTELLELAAVAGPEFELVPIREAAGLPEAELLEALRQAVASGMLEEVAGRGLTFRFTHELVRRALYDRLSLLRRAELHLRFGEGLEAVGSPSGRRVVDLARHFGAAADLGGAERAIDYHRQAAAGAADALAYADAAVHLRAAIEIGIEPPSERAAVLLDLGAAANRAGEVMRAIDAFAAAAEIGRELGDPRLLAGAAIGYEESCWPPALADGKSVALLEEALAEVDVSDQELRIALLAGLARALGFLSEPERAAIVRESAVALAREQGERPGLAKVLVRSYWSRGSTPLSETLEMLTEARDIASELGDVETYTEAMSWRVPTFVALCDLDSARVEVGRLAAMAERTAQPVMNHIAEHYRSALALCDGDLAEAERTAERSREWGELLTGRGASGTYGVQMFGIRREQGRLAELAPAVRILAGDSDRHGPWRPGLTAVLAELGMEDEARRELSRVVASGIEEYRASLWLATLTYLTDASSAIGDEATAAIVYPELEPFAGTNVMIGHLVSCYGSADRYLGMLAATLGERERAEAHFERAIEMNREMGASTWLAHTAYQYGRFLLGGGRRRRAHAAAYLDKAVSLAGQIGMTGLLAKARSLGVGATPSELPAGLSPREAQILALVARGLSNREIGVELSISEHTVANHIRAILRKTECANRTEAASFAHRHGLASI
ncbi:MAG TPA: AAA family ATPase [Solirubrobacterales bacterium]|nr:AAA family ATPase [Solirubrobacterales bacterium]